MHRKRWLRAIERTDLGRPVDTGTGTMIGVRIHITQLLAIDPLAASEDGEPSRPEAIRRLMAKAPGQQVSVSVGFQHFSHALD